MCLNNMNLPALGSFHHTGKGRGKKLAQIMKDLLGKVGWRTASDGGQQNIQNLVEQGVYMPKQTTTENKEHLENGSN